MIHFIYKTTHVNGKYYVGRHSTENIDDGYIGSGLWPRSIKDQTTLTREVLEYATDSTALKLLEGKYLAEHYGKPGCMNLTSDPVGFDSENNPMKNPEVVKNYKGNNHWSKRDPDKFKEKLSGDNHWMNQDLKAKTEYINNHPMKKSANRKKVSERITQQNLTNNPSKWRSEAGIHHWQNGNSPNAGGKLNKKLVAAGTHNLIGPEHNRKMIAEGKNPWVGADSNLQRLANGTHPSQQKKTCEHCGKTTSVAMYTRWHGENCSQAWAAHK
jgi:hypothetical protein